MLSLLLNLVINGLVFIALTGFVLGILAWRFRSWRPLFRLYLKTLKFSVVGIARLLWRPAFRRQGIGHLVEQRRQPEER